MYDLMTKLPFGLEGDIYRSPLPLSPQFDPSQEVLSLYVKADIDVVVMLTPDEEAVDVIGQNLRLLYRDFGFEVIYVPVEDFSIPARGAFDQPIKETMKAAKSGKNIAIHCHAGLGRTGTFAACLAKVVFDMTGEEAVDWIRDYIPGAIQTREQYRYVLEFDHS